MNNLFASFIAELFSRLVTKKPVFFKYAQWVALSLGAVTGIPAWLTSEGITLPPIALPLESKVVAWCSIGFAIATQLVSAKPAATVSADGTVLQTTDPKKLPFTAKMEVKDAQNKQVPNSSLTLAEIKK